MGSEARMRTGAGPHGFCSSFDKLWTDYQEHIPKRSAGGYTCVRDSRVELNDNRQYIQTAKYRYVCGNLTTTVYHIFARIEPKQ